MDYIDFNKSSTYHKEEQEKIKEIMASKYKEKITKEIDDIPEEMIPKIYKLVHLLTKEFIDKKKHTGKRGSLKGIGKGSIIDDKLYNDAK